MIHVEVDEERSSQVVDALERFADKFADLFIADVILGQATEGEVKERTKQLIELGAVDSGLDKGTFALLAAGLFQNTADVADAVAEAV